MDNQNLPDAGSSQPTPPSNHPQPVVDASPIVPPTPASEPIIPQPPLPPTLEPVMPTLPQMPTQTPLPPVAPPPIMPQIPQPVVPPPTNQPSMPSSPSMNTMEQSIQQSVADQTPRPQQTAYDMAQQSFNQQSLQQTPPFMQSPDLPHVVIPTQVSSTPPASKGNQKHPGVSKGYVGGGNHGAMKKVLIALIVLLTLTVGGSGIYYVLSLQGQTQQQIAAVTPSPLPTVAPIIPTVPVDPYAGWQSMTLDALSFKIPTGWTTSESNDAKTGDKTLNLFAPPPATSSAGFVLNVHKNKTVDQIKKNLVSSLKLTIIQEQVATIAGATGITFTATTGSIASPSAPMKWLLFPSAKDTFSMQDTAVLTNSDAILKQITDTFVLTQPTPTALPTQALKPASGSATTPTSSPSGTVR